MNKYELYEVSGGQKNVPVTGEMFKARLTVLQLLPFAKGDFLGCRLGIKTFHLKNAIRNTSVVLGPFH